MTYRLLAAGAAAALCLGAGAAQAAEPYGQWKRDSGETVEVSDQGGKLYCKIVDGEQAGFEMCHGMSPAGPNTWKGEDMTHPSMGENMTFDGTVIVNGGQLSIEGCTLFGAMCDEETWTKLSQ